MSSVVSTQKAHKLIKKVKSKLREEIGETSLKELKSDVKNMLKRVLKEDEEEFENIVARLMKLRDKINKRIDDLKKTNRKRNQCPKGSLPKWDGACDTYLDFRDSMQDLLTYDSQFLGLSTLKAQITGQNKAYICSLLNNVKTVKAAWEQLDEEYGNWQLGH